MNCPRCKNKLILSKLLDAELYSCKSCESGLISKNLLLNKFSGEFIRNIRNSIISLTLNSSTPYNIRCPKCNHTMFQFTSHFRGTNHPIDFCSNCSLFWLDKVELESILINRNQELNNVRSNIVNLESIKLEQNLEKDRYRESNSIAIWQRIFGLKLEGEHAYFSKFPITIWIISSILIFLNIKTWMSHSDILQFSLIPSDPLKNYGFNLISSFFIHMNPYHLGINIYFLLLFGDRIENEIGKMRILALLFLSAFFASLMDILIRSNSEIPSVGAGGGIAGLLMYFTLAYPNTKISIPVSLDLRFLNFHLSINAHYITILWLFLHIIINSYNLNFNIMLNISGSIIGFLSFYYINK